MQKFKQRLFLKKVEKLLNKPAPQAEIYDTTMHTMYVGATAPRTAGHFADSAVSVKLGQVKRIAEMVGGVLEVLLVDEEANGEDVEARFMELEVRFQEMNLGLLFTQQEETERRIDCGAAAEGAGEGSGRVAEGCTAGKEECVIESGSGGDEESNFAVAEGATGAEAAAV